MENFVSIQSAKLKVQSGECHVDLYVEMLIMMLSEKVPICHPELVSGSRKPSILLDGESSSA
jgi:hypothetical protein